MSDHCREIEARTGRACDDAAIHGAGYVDEAACRRDPAIERKALQGCRHRSSRFMLRHPRYLTRATAVDTMVASSNN
jgi:hypothetical protein